MTAFTRGFKLHHNGQVLDGAAFPSDRVFVLDDPEYGLASAATSLDELLKGYHGARVEWADEQAETVTVPMALLLDLVAAVGEARLSKGATARTHAVVAALTRHLGYDVAERAAEQEAARALARGETHL